ncbi:hypothetical protein Aple_061150 [Acrocarpospora pleiomorpha]|uniref:Uncharacterized protein n=1 Tax=Acrocarpospora pleiomorpha TaxID=90975 RepID=A0A5M3XR26_9ACTN|nr:hypothetical protein Aple_061150 [Acrocarpospora pleiomorpha]
MTDPAVATLDPPRLARGSRRLIRCASLSDGHIWYAYLATGTIK